MIPARWLSERAWTYPLIAAAVAAAILWLAGCGPDRRDAERALGTPSTCVRVGGGEFWVCVKGGIRWDCIGGGGAITCMPVVPAPAEAPR